VLGSFANSRDNASEPLRRRAHPRAEARDADKREQQLNQFIEDEWSELPYAMMRLTAARRPWDGKRVYWRDQNVQLGDIDLNLLKTRAEDDPPTYTAVYTQAQTQVQTQAELRRDFTLHPSLEADQLRWSAPEICDAQLTTAQLAEKLLARLVTFYTTGLTASTSRGSPDPAS
jgi:hypothetical protein